ncbi:FG-GAP-like repeat-containing protein [Janthinobacterium aestuarii]
MQIYNPFSATLPFTSPLEMLKISAVSNPARHRKQEFLASLSFVSICSFIAFALPYAAQAAVHTPGKLSVSDLGAATYTVPIAVPPGTAGMAPALALSFNSQSSGGIMGKGWSLSGLSSIARCAQTPNQDGGVLGAVQLDANDRFCLDGQRLMVSNAGAYGGDGTEYRTENDGFSKIVSYGGAGNGPAWFKVWTKAGRVLEYGNTADSRIEAQGTSTVRTWAINREQDVKSNYLTVAYTEDNANGDFYPVRIDYTGNANVGMAPNNAVRFTYEALPRVISGYQAGRLVQSTVRLKQIALDAAGVNTANYRLNYLEDALTQRSRLNGITQCDGGQVNCLPPIKFDWQDPGTFAQKYGEWMNTGAPIHTMADMNNYGFLTLDLNGDGKTDLVQTVERDGRTWLLPMYSNGTGFILGALFDTGMGSPTSLLVADVDGDGVSELVHILTYETAPGNYNNITRKIHIFYPTVSGFRIADAGTYRTERIGNAFSMDVDGDGKSEIVEYKYDQYDNFNLRISISKFDGNVFSPPAWKINNSRPSQISMPPSRYPTMANVIPMDINGDGKMDLVQTWTEVSSPDNVWLLSIISNGTDLVPGVWLNTGLQWRFPERDGMPDGVESIIPLDMNGDGMTDLMLSGHAHVNEPISGKLVNLHPFYSNGISFVAGKKEILHGVASNTPYGKAGPSPGSIISIDINGDGKSDLLQIWQGDGSGFEDLELLLEPVISLGNGFLLDQPIYHTGQKWGTVDKLTPDVDEGYVSYPDGPGLIALDINGDGKMDLVQQKYKLKPFSAPTENVSLLPYLADSGIGDLLTGVTNGLGAKTAIRYTALTDPATYVRDTATSYPYMNMLMPLYVVASVDHPNGIGSSETVKYRYGGLKKDLSRGELAGFRWKEELQVSTGLTSTVEYRLDWPYTGMAAKTSTSLAGSGSGNLLSQTIATFGCMDTLAAAPCAVRPGRSYFPYVSESVVQQWDLNGAALPVKKTTAQYDSWGNLIRSTATASDGGKTFTTYTENAFYPVDRSRWLTGQLARTMVSNTIPAYTGPALPTGDGSTPGSGNGGTGGTPPGTGTHISTIGWVAGYPQPARVDVGKPTTLQVQVSGTTPLRGTVTFFDGDAALAVIALDGAGKAGFSTALTGFGSRAIRAAYSGDANNAPSTANATVVVGMDMTPILMLLMDE